MKSLLNLEEQLWPFEPLRLGSLTLPNRILIARLTRLRAGNGNVPTALNAAHCAHRATAGLIIAEGIALSDKGRGYPAAPGIYTPEQVEGWKAVTQAVNAKNGRIYPRIPTPQRPSAIPDRVEEGISAVDPTYTMRSFTLFALTPSCFSG